MKQISLVFNAIKKTALMFSACTFAMQTAYAQPAIVLPTLSDNTLFTTTNPVVGVATAMIAYGTGNTIYAMSSGTTSNMIYINDDAVGSASVAATGNVGSSDFDMVMGNWNGFSTGCSSCISTSTDYILACSYRDASSGRVTIDYYDVYDDGISTVSVNPLPALTSRSGVGAYNPVVVHMDVIAEAGNTIPTGRPFCDKFVVTWDDASGNIFAVKGSLNAPPAVLAGTRINPLTNTGRQPDVAAIQRNGFPMPNRIHDIGIFTYIGNTNPSTQAVYKIERDFTAGTTSAITTLDAISSPGAFTWPRIDAIDDYNINNSALTSNYKIVVGAYNAAAANPEQARTYDNLQIGLTPPYYETSQIDLTTIPYGLSTPNYITDRPVVAYGSGLEYEILHATNYLAGTADSNICFLERVTLTSPQALNGNQVYWVNSDGAPLTALAHMITSISAPVNDPGIASVFAWSSFVPGSSSHQVSYKTIGTTYAFKHAPSVVANVEAQKWQAYPNPAKNTLTLQTQAGYEANRYQVTDIMGRTVLKGQINSNNQNINMATLNSGSYFIGIYNGDSKKQSIAFVKE